MAQGNALWWEAEIRDLLKAGVHGERLVKAFVRWGEAAGVDVTREIAESFIARQEAEAHAIEQQKRAIEAEGVWWHLTHGPHGGQAARAEAVSRGVTSGSDASVL